MENVMRTNGQPVSKNELATIKIDGDVLDTTHNFPCPICYSNKATLNLNKGTFQPCSECAKKNWFTIKINSKFMRWLLGVGEYWYRSIR